MKYLVIEIQHNQDGTVGNFVFAYDDRNQAESKYHSILASAAVSQVYIHSAVLMTSTGVQVAHQSYTHGAEEETEE